MLKVYKEFKEFAIKGNMIDIAIGVIIGASFNKVTDVLVKKVLMPPVSLLVSDVNFKDKEWVLREAVIGEDGKTIANKVSIGYGEFAEAFMDFAIIAFCMFLVVKGMNRLRSKAQNPTDKSEKTPKDIELLSGIKETMSEQLALMRDFMKKEEN
ncbi:large conductance mechanosensitive channel [Sinomicrobium oceani]|uniref:Large-conductance mechanosensitive channel n=1 Tax=Sinomicrobium oceani TaxID=1150368 RepID=A0A1K1QMA3_9FLAO|nr:large conductance mechanosensitive channel protein MscL [Sinomicrobium oceani]SFW60909.1 large conductance mechanosensitive channel [Sinomicrobium oceani]